MEYLQNITVSEFGKIKSNILNNFLTVMLCVNAVSITVTVGVLDNGLEYPQKWGLIVCVFSSSLAVFLFFLLQPYLETLTYRFYRIDPEKMSEIAKVAKRFFYPFLIGIILDVILACLGVVILLNALLHKSI